MFGDTGPGKLIGLLMSWKMPVPGPGQVRDTGAPIYPGMIGGEKPKGRAKLGQNQTGKALKDASQTDPAIRPVHTAPGSNSSPLTLGLVDHFLPRLPRASINLGL